MQDGTDATDGGEDSDQSAESLISLLLRSSSTNVNCQDNYGSTPLHYAAQKGNPRAVEELLKFKVDVNVS